MIYTILGWVFGIIILIWFLVKLCKTGIFGKSIEVFADSIDVFDSFDGFSSSGSSDD
ncbi:MAG: hypothetical protein ACXW2E_01365 [Nitrososphaeraceae archaeon]